MATLAQNIQRAITDFNSIENAIVQKGVPVPDGTPTSEYGEKILSIESGVDTSGDTVVPSALREGYTAHDAEGQPIVGTISTYDKTVVAVPTREQFFGKWLFNETIDFSIMAGQILVEINHQFVTGAGTTVSYMRFNEASSPLNPYNYNTIDYSIGGLFKAYGATGGWSSQSYRTVDFGETPFEMTELQYNMFTANATFIGLTLDTKGKYCASDIDVSPMYDAGVEAGKQSEYDTFWDAYQNYGNRRAYGHAFARPNSSSAKGCGWPDSILRPKYDLICEQNTSAMFQYNDSTNIKRALESAGVVLDTSRVNGNFTQMFQGCQSEELPIVDASGATSLSYAFSACVNLIALHIKVSENTPYSNTFPYTRKITTFTIEGTIGQNGFNVSWSPLSKASLTSVVNALSSTTTGLTVTLRLAAVNTAFETSAGAADGSTSDEWTALIATKPNWTINLINS